MKNIWVVSIFLRKYIFTHLSKGEEQRFVNSHQHQVWKASANYGTNDTKHIIQILLYQDTINKRGYCSIFIYRVRVKYRPLCQNTSLSKAEPLLLGELDKRLITTHCMWTDVVCNFHSSANVGLKCILLCHLNAVLSYNNHLKLLFPH